VRRVLFLAYHFPPIGGGGVQRSLRFVRHLRDFGYESIVITGPATATGRWTPRDETLASDLPPGLRVLRVSDQPKATSHIRRRARIWLGRESMFDRWWTDGAADVGLRAADVDLVYASLSPYSSAVAAQRIAGALGKPWIADLRDPWALDEMTVYPTSLHRRLELERMKESLGTADAVVMNTPEAARRLVATMPELGCRTVISIPNGWESADFAGPEPHRSDGAFRIVHTGNLHTELGRVLRRRGRARRLLGGEVRGVDALTRSHVYLLRAIARVGERAPELAPHIELHLAGVLSDSDRAVTTSNVRAHGYLSHAESVELIRSADLLFLPMHDLPQGTNATIVPGKTYEYLASGRPILAALPDGDARDLLSVAPETATLCRPTDVAGMADAIEERCRRVLATGRAPTDVPVVASAYEAQQLTSRLADAFDGILGGAAHPHRSLVSTAW
jgi:glycosyltransferase involved in cell wall biosynthesis